MINYIKYPRFALGWHKKTTLNKFYISVTLVSFQIIGKISEDFLKNIDKRILLFTATCRKLPNI